MCTYIHIMICTYLGIHNHKGNENPMIKSSRVVEFAFQVLSLEQILDFRSQIRASWGWIFVLVCLCWKIVVIVVHFRSLSGSNLNRIGFPMCTDNHDGLGGLWRQKFPHHFSHILDKLWLPSHERERASTVVDKYTWELHYRWPMVVFGFPFRCVLSI